MKSVIAFGGAMFICGITLVSGGNYLVSGEWFNAFFPITIFVINALLARMGFQGIRKMLSHRAA